MVKTHDYSTIYSEYKLQGKQRWTDCRNFL